MKKSHLYLLTTILVCLCLNSYSQSIDVASFNVGGSTTLYYPVVFTDPGWSSGATEFEITRASTHIDRDWWGSIIAKFRIHTTQWGNGSSLIDADIRSSNTFVAEWVDATTANGGTTVIVWLRGGTTYYFRSTNSRMAVPGVYIDGYQQVNGPMRTALTSVRATINTNGMNYGGDFSVSGNGIFQSNLLIGKSTQVNTAYKLDVAGSVRANEVVVNSNGADFVFEPDYKLRPLAEVDSFITENKHLPDIKSASEMQSDGLNVSELNTKLLQKVEELTLYLIEQNKQIEELKKIIKQTK